MEFLQQHWAIISANPWLFFTWPAVVASGTWVVIHFLYRHRIDNDAIEIQRLNTRLGELKEERSSKVDAPATAPAAMARAEPTQYEPDELAVRVIRLLRIADGRWTTVEQMARFLEVNSQQDLQHALKKMRSLKWVEAHRANAGRDDSARSYRLDGPGIEFARKQGFPTLTEIEQEKKQET